MTVSYMSSYMSSYMIDPLHERSPTVSSGLKRSPVASSIAIHTNRWLRVPSPTLFSPFLPLCHPFATLHPFIPYLRRGTPDSVLKHPFFLIRPVASCYPSHRPPQQPCLTTNKRGMRLRLDNEDNHNALSHYCFMFSVFYCFL